MLAASKRYPFSKVATDCCIGAHKSESSQVLHAMPSFVWVTHLISLMWPAPLKEAARHRCPCIEAKLSFQSPAEGSG